MVSKIHTPKIVSWAWRTTKPMKMQMSQDISIPHGVS